MRTPARNAPTSSPVWRTVRRHIAIYALAVGIPVLTIAVLSHLGSRLFGTETAVSKTCNGGDAKPLFHLLVALTAILVAARLCGGLFVRFGQPRVIGEIVAGILLGPSLLGALSPGASAALIRPETLPILEAIGQLGLVLFMFQVGLDFDFNLVRRKGHVALLVSHASICLPFLGGVGLGLILYPLRYSETVPFLPFALFMGLAMSVTAFPVLTRILRDRNMVATPLGTLALACAAADDITAWCLLAALLGLSQSSAADGMSTFAWAIVFCLVMGGIIRPLARRVSRSFVWSNLPTMLLGLFCTALVAEWTGIHAFFGAFIFGLCVPRQVLGTAHIRSKLEAVTGGLLLPAYFVTSGFRTSLGTLGDVDGWLVCAAVVAVATAGKLIGTIAPARLAGLDWRQSLRLGALMNTRGLMEIVIANVGLECGIIPAEMFTALVVMALVTTMAAGPLLNALEGGRQPARGDLADAPGSQHEAPAELCAVTSDRSNSALAGGNS